MQKEIIQQSLKHPREGNYHIVGVSHIEGRNNYQNSTESVLIVAVELGKNHSPLCVTSEITE